MGILGLSSEQIAFFQENGYVLVRGLITPEEAAAYRRECHALAERLQKLRSIEATWDSVRQSGQKTSILHCDDVQFHVAAFARLLVDERFTRVAQDIIGPNVQLHHTKMFIKPPEKGSPFPMHKDYPYFPHERHSMMAAIIHFDDEPLEKGCLRVYPGSHKLGPLPPAQKDHSLDPAEWPLEKATAIPAHAGDAIFFNYLTIHGSGLNVSNEARTTVLVQMRDPEDPPTVKAHESKGQGMMLAGIDPTGMRVPAWETAAAAPAMGAAMGAPAMSGR
jgi:ectoine hydroxylase-related dioxygenase (phytanoyl-CoA dioxygenase family)